MKDFDHLAESCISRSRPINGFLQTSESTDIVLDGNPVFEKTYFDANGYREQQHLTKIYLTQVEPILNILQPDRPSVEAYLLSGNSYLDYDLEHPAPTALASAIYYVASCALSAEKCVSEFGMSKEDLVSKYQTKSKFALERADYMITEDITVLQGFVISLVNEGPIYHLYSLD